MNQEQIGAVIAGHILYALCNILGIRTTSWKRSAGTNKAVGGAPASLHLIGGAVDFGRETPQEKIDMLRKLGFTVEYHTKGTAPHFHAYGGWKSIAIVGGGAAVVTAAAKSVAKG